MPAYLIGEVQVTDPAGYQEYRQKAAASIAQYGGRYLVRGGDAHLLEGEEQPARLVVLEFPDMAALERWHDSPEYTEAAAIRHRTAVSRIIAVEGV